MIDLTLNVAIAALASGLIVGVFLGTFGGGGSVLAAPLLMYWVGVASPHIAIGTSAAAVAAIALFSLIGHWRGGRVKWPCAAFFAGAGLIGSLVGSTIAKSIGGDLLLFAFAIAMAAIGASMLRPPTASGDPDTHITPQIMARIAPVGLCVGGAAGFFGIGGGFLIVPGLMLASGMTLANATASSLVSVAIFGAATSANYALGGFVDFRIVLLLLLGGAAGGAIGVGVAKTLEDHVKLGRRAFAAMIILVAIYIGWNAGFSILNTSAA